MLSRRRRSGLAVPAFSAVLGLASLLTFGLGDRRAPTHDPDPDLVDRLVRLHGSADIAQRRCRMIEMLWGSDELPRRLPRVETAIEDPRFATTSGLASIDRLTITMDFGLESIAYLFHAQHENGRLVIYHQGHRGGFVRGRRTVGALLSDGYAVLALSMPLVGMNNQPLVESPEFGPIHLTSHSTLKLLRPEHGHPLRYFLEPVAIAVNYAESVGYRDLAMIGISGGGWTTTVYAAIDPRIRQSFPVAGSLPMYLRSDAKWGDWEQTEPELYRIANYLELYLMGAAGPGRSQLQILNRFDPCCFGGDGYRSYLPVLRARAREIGTVDYDLFVDETNLLHRISPRTLRRILRELERVEEGSVATDSRR